MHPYAIGRRILNRVKGMPVPGFGMTAVFVLLMCAACRSAGTERTVTLLTHDSFAVSESVLRRFEESAGVKVVVLESGDAGAALNKAVLTKQAPLADVFFGVDNTFLARALQEGIFEAYESPLLESVPAAFRLDPENRALPVDYGDVCINYDREWFSSRSLAVPVTLEALARPEYEGLLAVENPYTSSPGLAFLLATVAHFGPAGFTEYWASLKTNRVQVVDGWETAYYTNFSASSGRGPQPMVVSYATSPAFELIYADPPRAEPPTASLTGPEMCFRQIEFAGILAGTAERKLSEQLIDFLLSRAFQEDVPMQMAMFPVDPQAGLPDAFVQFARAPSRPAVIAPEDIAAHREEWMALWKEIMLP
jgi:thiamine transport system substrate-binding protein